MPTSSKGKRIGGRAGTELRKRRMARSNWLCEDCSDKGLVKTADEVDHITPLAFGGKDIDENTRNLCCECHLIKTSEEGSLSLAAATHPDWLRPSAIPITVVCGPPCSGKTTYINSNSVPGDILIDLDTIQAKINPSHKHWQDWKDSALLSMAIRQRNSLLGGLCQMKRGKAWFIVHAPSEAERLWWQDKLGAEIVLLHPGVEECKRRAIERGTPLAVKGIDAWESASKQPWSPLGTHKRRKVATGLDGWPV